MANSELTRSRAKKGDDISELALADLLALVIHSLPDPSENQTRLLASLAHLQVLLATQRFQLSVLGPWFLLWLHLGP